MKLPLIVKPEINYHDLSEHHINLAHYAQATNDWKRVPPRESHKDIWMNGYQRFGDRFEAAAALWNSNRRYSLQHFLKDQWNICGLESSEVTDETKRLLMSEVFTEDYLAELIIKLAEEQPPNRFTELLDWAGVSGAGFHGLPWTHFARSRLGVPESWTFENFLVLVDSDLDPEEVSVAASAGVTDLTLMLATLRGEIPLEYAVAAN